MVAKNVSQALPACARGAISHEGYSTFSWTLSSESGESTAKQMRITWESGYDSGRRRS